MRPAFKPSDSGPIYTETNFPGDPVVEPFNTGSNLIFLAIAAFWTIRLTKSNYRPVFLAFCLPVLFIAWIGGTLYHALRTSDVWLLMDYLPIAILCAATSLYFWIRLKRLPLGLVVVIVSTGAVRLAQIYLPERLGISFGYLGFALLILAPIALNLVYTSRRHAKWIAGAFSSVCIALIFRELDRFAGAAFPIGTHFLWHLFGGISSFCLIQYIFLDARRGE